MFPAGFSVFVAAQVMVGDKAENLFIGERHVSSPIGRNDKIETIVTMPRSCCVPEREHLNWSTATETCEGGGHAGLDGSFIALYK